VSESPDQKPESAAPELSVILVVGGQRKRAAAALRSLLEQSIIDRIEILLFDLGPEYCSALPGSNHPRVRITRRGPNNLLATAQVQGIRAAKAPVVCFMEEHCEVQPGWAEAIALAHRGPWAGVGCDFVSGNPDAGNSDKAFRMNYGVYVHPSHGRGPVKRIPGQNSAFKRDILLRYEPQLEWMITGDFVLPLKMEQDGNQLFYEPKAKMAHRNENTLRSLCVGAFYWNWCFANIQAQVFRWSFPRRALRIVLSPLIPWVRLAKMFVQTWRLGRSQFAQFVGDIPFILVVHHCSAAGQVAGLLNPLDTGAREFSHFEMNEPRLLRAEIAR
jgi:GT2 family glycosyltransferase